MLGKSVQSCFEYDNDDKEEEEEDWVKIDEFSMIEQQQKIETRTNGSTNNR